ncbi:phosphoribosyltransferase family protein [Zhihengliuella sp.]|uniref:phosphoribosyltransferase n=1 Tax=Zhihengliuella sp. TaxID=1954483 RepID=UPI00281186AD|nr:phosphoribosyltransferase family protein [Zhihengliuella sp.]
MGEEQPDRGSDAVAPYADRHEAAVALAAELEHEMGGALRARSPLVLGLARGGVPVAAGIARALGLDWDALIVRKLGIPGHSEVAFGAVAAHAGHTAEYRVETVLRSLPRHVTRRQLRRVEREETAELRRRQQDYLDGRSAPVRGRTVVLADDGLATGATMHAAADAVRAAGAQEIVIAIPVGPPDVCAELARSVDRLVCPRRPTDFRAVGAAYRRFEQVTDSEVLALLDGRKPGLGRA